MEIRVLKYFIAVAEEENITRAAERLNIAQPSLSRQLMQLENELDAKLFERSKKGISLTEEGRILRQYAEEIISLNDKTEQVFSARKRQLGGLISIGCTETLGAETLPQLLKAFTEKSPDINFDVLYGNTDDIKEKVLNGIMDVGLVIEPINHENYNCISIEAPLKWGIIMNKDMPLAKEKYITQEMLSGLPLLVPHTRAQYDWLKKWFRENESHMNIYATYNSISGIIMLAKHGLGYAFAMQTALQYADSRELVFVPLRPERHADAILIWGKNTVPSPAVKRFINFINVF